MVDNQVLLTFYLDSDIDDEIRQWVGGDGFSSALFQHWLIAGMCAADKGASLPPRTPQDQPPILRTAHIDARVDSRLRIENFWTRVPRMELVMGYLRLGKECAKPLKRIPGACDRPRLKTKAHQPAVKRCA